VKGSSCTKKKTQNFRQGVQLPGGKGGGRTSTSIQRLLGKKIGPLKKTPRNGDGKVCPTGSKSLHRAQVQQHCKVVCVRGKILNQRTCMSRGLPDAKLVFSEKNSGYNSAPKRVSSREKHSLSPHTHNNFDESGKKLSWNAP